MGYYDFNEHFWAPEQVGAQKTEITRISWLSEIRELGRTIREIVFPPRKAQKSDSD